jgi:hypothetical protein
MTPRPEQVAHAANWLRNARRIARPAIVQDGRNLVPGTSVTVSPNEIGELTDAAALLEAQQAEIRRLSCLLSGAHETINRHTRFKGA